MIKFHKADITKVKTGVIVHGVNCKKVMGAGVAKAIKTKWPVVYDRFLETPAELGNVRLIRVGGDLMVGNLYSQDEYGREPGARYACPTAIKKGLQYVCDFAWAAGFDVHMPKIGCGLGGLDWDRDVLPIIEDLRLDREVTINVYEL